MERFGSKRAKCRPALDRTNKQSIKVDPEIFSGQDWETALRLITVLSKKRRRVCETLGGLPWQLFFLFLRERERKGEREGWRRGEREASP